MPFERGTLEFEPAQIYEITPDQLPCPVVIHTDGKFSEGELVGRVVRSHPEFGGRLLVHFAYSDGTLGEIMPGDSPEMCGWTTGESIEDLKGHGLVNPLERRS
ncbi:MAG TPA: hypothetical protein PKD15_06215 [Candidatus Saccharibacteria bacterium]|jgi:hypothetical protein|nr:hypothetical protein [Candidatus Saccharibacteria bacterium]